MGRPLCLNKDVDQFMRPWDLELRITRCSTYSWDSSDRIGRGYEHVGISARGTLGILKYIKLPRHGSRLKRNGEMPMGLGSPPLKQWDGWSIRRWPHLNQRSGQVHRKFWPGELWEYQNIHCFYRMGSLGHGDHWQYPKYTAFTPWVAELNGMTKSPWDVRQMGHRNNLWGGERQKAPNGWIYENLDLEKFGKIKIYTAFTPCEAD